MAENNSDFIIDDGFGAMLSGMIDPGQAAEEAFLNHALEILNYAKQNAPWADRTGAARAGLDVNVGRDGNEVYLELFHTVDYGLWLETIQGGEFATIMPTLEKFADEVFSAAGAIVEASEGGDVG